MEIRLDAVGMVESPLKDPASAPHQGFRVRDLEAVDGTPIVDVKPPLSPREG